MSLRQKTLLFASLVAVALVASLYFGTATVLLGGFEQVEQAYAEGKVKLAERTLVAERETLRAHIIGWSAWNGMYSFVNTPNGAFARFELSAPALSPMNPDFFVVLRPDGEVVLERLMGSLTGEGALPELRSYLRYHGALRRFHSLHDAHTEITVIAGKPALLATAPIVTSESRGPIRGTLVVGRFLTARRIAVLKQMTGLDLSLTPLVSPSVAANPSRVSQVRLASETMQSRTLIADFSGRDVLVLGVTTRRPIYAQALRSREALLAVVIVVSLLFILLTSYLLHRTVLSRLAALSRGVRAITQERSFTGRLALHGHDEFAGLAADTNEMLEVLERSQREVSENQARYALVLQGINDGVWDCDLTTGETYFSARWRSMLGYPEAAVVAKVDLSLSHIHPDDFGRVSDTVGAYLRGETEFFESEARMRLLDGSCRWMLLRGVVSRDARGTAVRMAGSLTDLTRRGLFDALTGLPNRVLLLERLEHSLSRAEDTGERSSALLFMDLNRFKLINDSLGHHVGDLLLVEVAKRLQGAVRQGDTVARFGGDEFVVLMTELNGEEDVRRAVERISGATTTELSLAERQLSISLSIGVIANLSVYPDATEALRDADNAMYHAKAHGLPFSYFDKHMLARTRERLQFEADLRHAIENGELSLAFQPVILFRENRMSGIEALVRWQHPQRGPIPPSTFIPIAEEAGLIGALGEWVLREACRAVKRLGGGLSLGVNVSGKQLGETLAERVTDILSETGFPPQRLVLEVTESAVIADPNQAARVLTHLRKLGVRVALDDFGTGYSSLSYLSTLPLDILKIDRTFVARLMADAQSVAIVRTIVTLAQSLELSVVAEGVETLEQAELLRSLGCPYAQGYYFAPPVALEALPPLANRTFDVDTNADAGSAH